MHNIVLGGDHIRQATSDPEFYKIMPEFASLQTKFSALVTARGRQGCSSCAKRTIQGSLHGDFVNILNTLSTSAMLRLKKYLKADTLMVNAYDNTTGKTVLKRY